MSRDHRKISRSFEERNILASTTRVSQISQADNELKQKLQAIDTSHKLSNKRIKNETRELKEILHGLQRELKVSKGNYGQYVPSLMEQPQRKPRRTTVSSVPSEDRKEDGLERDLHAHGGDKNSCEDTIPRRRSGSYPPSLHLHDSKRTKDVLDDEPAENKPSKALEKTGGEVKDVAEQTKSWKQIGDWQSEVNARKQNRTEFPEIEQDKYSHRRITRTENEQKRIEERSAKEPQDQGERKRSTSDAFRARFVINSDSCYTSTNGSTTRRTSKAQQKGDSGRLRQRPSVVEEFSSFPSPNEPRKTSFSTPQYPWQMKGSIGDRKGSPMAGSPGRYDLHDAEVVFDALPDYLGGRRLSVAHGRARKISRGTGLPPLREGEVTQKSQQEKSAENWSDLTKCRYLRKEEQEISIDDIFSKE